MLSWEYSVRDFRANAHEFECLPWNHKGLAALGEDISGIPTEETGLMCLLLSASMKISLPKFLNYWVIELFWIKKNVIRIPAHTRLKNVIYLLIIYYRRLKQ
jgi:hypothetical protein